jgi:beta-phosphoglucomutase-like phosphatase (HAD superfamily)
VNDRIEIAPRRFDGYLFDCDGTIADSIPPHDLAWRTALTEWTCGFSEDLFYAWAGFAVAKIIFLLNEKHGLNMPVGDVARRKEELYLEALANLRPFLKC